MHHIGQNILIQKRSMPLDLYQAEFHCSLEYLLDCLNQNMLRFLNLTLLMTSVYCPLVLNVIDCRVDTLYFELPLIDNKLLQFINTLTRKM